MPFPAIALAALARAVCVAHVSRGDVSLYRGAPLRRNDRTDGIFVVALRRERDLCLFTTRCEKANPQDVEASRVKLLRVFSVALCALILPIAASGANDRSVRDAIRGRLDAYLAQRATIEHISTVAVRVNLSNAPPIDVAAGTTTYFGSIPAQSSQLVQIGSNTKAFIAVLLLQLEAAGKLRIDDRIGRWLPEYPAWSGITVRHLLDMTSGIPTYDDDERMLRDYAHEPYRHWPAAELIAYVYPRTKFAPGRGWLYSNTGYLLAQLIVERITGQKIADALQRRIFTPLGLTHTYYSDGIYPQTILAQMPAGYFYNHSPDNAGLAPLLGRDVKAMSLSWAQGAGAIVQSLPDLARWSHALYHGPLLAATQRAELTTLVSVKTGKRISGTSAGDPEGFGLGVGQMMRPNAELTWFYEGKTLGYRTLYAYQPKRDLLLTVAINSQPDDNKDKIGTVVEGVLRALKDAGRI